MSEGNSLITINLGDLSKPATTLIKKVSAAVGVLYEPYHVKRMARAEVEADKIRALAKIELTQIEERAIHRFVQQEVRKQENIEHITAQAAMALPPDAEVEGLDEDWIAHFFTKCDTVSDRDMQSLWAGILAGEATKSGSFSKRTVDFTSTIDKKDAALFTAFCQFVWMIGEPTPLFYDLSDEIYKEQGLTFDSLKHLDAIGLISFETVSGYSKTGFGKYAHVFYYGQPTVIEFEADTNNRLEIGHVLLTSVGKELVSICGSQKNSSFYEHVLRKWAGNNLVLSSIVQANLQR